MLQEPAKPAQVQFDGGSLSIEADNSSLDAILRSLSSQSGMQIEGLGHDERVFGKFGPGTPRDVLSDLLNGTPYNLEMVGDLSNGVPRQLILSPVGAAAPASTGPTGPTGPMQHAPNDQSGDADADQTPPPAVPMRSPDSVQTGPSSQTVKTPQQLFEELQAMRQKQAQQQQQQQSQQPQD
jgi:hypothetical protein